MNDLEVFNIPPNIFDGGFCEDNKVLKAVNYFRKENLSEYKFNRVQNTPLLFSIQAFEIKLSPM